MESELLITAILMGFGFGNIFLCMFVAMGTSVGRGWKVGFAFLGGRLAGVMALGIFIALFGWFVDLNPRMMILIFALLSLVFGVLVLLWPHGLAKLRLLRPCETGGCENCSDDTQSDVHEHDCSSCNSMECSKKSIQTQDTKKIEENKSHRGTRFEGLSIMSIALLGLIRGATPCLKILLLVPLILTVSFYESVAITGLFAVSSSIYTVIGIMAGSILGMTFTERRMPQLRSAGAILIIGIGIYYMYKFWTFSCPGGI